MQLWAKDRPLLAESQAKAAAQQSEVDGE